MPRSICSRSASIPQKAMLFVQSDVPEVTELTWLLMSITPMGLLEALRLLQGQSKRRASPPMPASSRIPC